MRKLIPAEKADSQQLPVVALPSVMLFSHTIMAKLENRGIDSVECQFWWQEFVQIANSCMMHPRLDGMYASYKERLLAKYRIVDKAEHIVAQQLAS